MMTIGPFLTAIDFKINTPCVTCTYGRLFVALANHRLQSFYKH
jgi:hypothetical protein